MLENGRTDCLAEISSIQRGVQWILDRMLLMLYRACLKGGPMLCERYRQIEADVVSNSRNKIHFT